MTHRFTVVAVLAVLSAVALPASAQTPSARPVGRISFYADTARLAPDGTPAFRSSDFITAFSFQLAEADGDGLEYGIDLRQSSYTQRGTSARTSIYDGYAGVRLANGHARVRAGQMWLADLGGIGSVAGTAVEYRRLPEGARGNRWHVGAFWGMEPASFRVGYVPGVHKVGGYVSIDGPGGRHSAFGYVRLMDGKLVERSVITMTNFLPARQKYFLYQTAEYDLVGPAGQGSGGLSYLMLNAHAAPSSVIDLQGLYHRGRSIDTRTITDDILNGRPLPDGALDGYLFSSIGGRLAVRVVHDVRLDGGFTRERNNHDSAPTDRLTAGAHFTNVARTGLDLTVSESHIRRSTGPYNSLYLSAGRQIGRAVYLSGDYSSSVAVVRYTGSDGLTVETRPLTRQVGVSSVINIGRHVSLLVMAERTRDDTSSELRMMSGLTYRLP